MAGITLAQAEARLAEYLAAEAAVLSEQSFTMAGKALTRADLDAIQKGIETWDARCKALDATGTLGTRGRSVTVAPNW